MGTPRRRLTIRVRKDFDPQRIYTLVMGIKGRRKITDLIFMVEMMEKVTEE